MKRKPIQIKSAVLMSVLIIAAVLIVNVILYACGIGTFRSAVRVGYIGNETRTGWSGSYAKLDGQMWRTLYPNDRIHVQVETTAGTISIEMKDADGTVILDEENIATSEFDVAAAGKTKVLIEAADHSGSFDMTCE